MMIVNAKIIAALSLAYAFRETLITCILQSLIFLVGVGITTRLLIVNLLNFTLPCGDSCPMRYAKAKRCHISHDRTTLYVDFSTPVINETLMVVEADAFD
jgi:hypothetical protein